MSLAGAHRVRNNWARVIVGVVMLGVLGYEIQWLAPHVARAAHALSHPSCGSSSAIIPTHSC